MRTKLIIAVLVLLVLSCGLEPVATDTPVWTPEPTSTVVPTWTARPPVLARVFVVTDSLHLRECPGEACPAILQMPAGTLVGLEYGRDDGWVMVRVIGVPVDYPALQVYVGARGWCYSEWLEER